MWLKAPNIQALHGFSTRHGGLSPAPFDSLNLGGSDDLNENILANRKIALNALGLDFDSLCTLKQLHSADVCVASKGRQEGDALVSRQKGQILAVSIADCYPVLLEDPVNRVVGAVHAGWRGTLGRIAANAVKAMNNLGADVSQIRVAIGQGISQNRFEVGTDVLEKFIAAGFSEAHIRARTLDLAACNKQVLTDSGVPEENIWTMGRCTYEADFFSHRRDKGRTGRMWALIALRD
ncbi:MAG TPA: peptidoglycan editing factor PgeF [Bacteroidia bacterium]|nr:peptidoglycan editing factor PgeF [Bacteroidia bacterium]